MMSCDICCLRHSTSTPEDIVNTAKRAFERERKRDMCDVAIALILAYEM